MEQIKLSDYPTLTRVSIFDAQEVCNEEYRVEEVQGKLYRFCYRRTVQYGSIWKLNLVLGTLWICTAVFLILLGRKLVRPFASMEGLTTELAKGNLSVPIKAEKSRFFGKFLWSLDMLREKLEAHRELYDIGLHGPDVLFYYHAEKSTPVAALGNAMHDEPGRTFFDRARRVVHEEADREAALAYALGFVCHFALDSTCHPFVEQFTRESGVTHCEIETEFDNMLLRRDGYDPLTFFTASHIHPSAENARVIAPFYKDISEQTALESLKGMILVHKVLQASNPVKRWVVLTGMKVLGKYDGMHGLVANPQPNPQCTESNRKLDALYAKALPLAERLILEYVAKLDTDEPLDAAYDHTFGEF